MLTLHRLAHCVIVGIGATLRRIRLDEDNGVAHGSVGTGRRRREARGPSVQHQVHLLMFHVAS